MSAKYINPALPSMIRDLHKGDPSMNSVKAMLGLAADLVQELIDLRTEQGEPKWVTEYAAKTPRGDLIPTEGRGHRYLGEMAMERRVTPWLPVPDTTSTESEGAK